MPQRKTTTVTTKRRLRVPRPSDDRVVDRFDALVRNHSREIHGFLLKLTGNHCDAEELAQDVFVKAFRRLETLRERGAARSWLFTIAVNHFNDWLKQRRQVALRATRPLPDADVVDPAPQQPSGELMARELSRTLMTAIHTLPERQRTVLLLFCAKGFDYAAIAEMLGISTDAVKMSLFHARQKLRSRADRILGREEHAVE